MEAANDTRMSLAWLRIFLKPRSTFRYVVEHTSMNYATWIAVVFGVLSMLTSSMENSRSIVVDILVAITLGSVTGLIIWLIGYKLNFHIGRWFGGTGSKEEMKIATAWAFIPSITGTVLVYLPMTAIYGDSSFYYGNLDYPFQAMILLLGELMGVLSLIINIIAISEIHKLSIWKSVMVCIIPGVFLVMFAGVISLV